MAMDIVLNRGKSPANDNCIGPANAIIFQSA